MDLKVVVGCLEVFLIVVGLRSRVSYDLITLYNIMSVLLHSAEEQHYDLRRKYSKEHAQRVDCGVAYGGRVL